VVFFLDLFSAGYFLYFDSMDKSNSLVFPLVFPGNSEKCTGTLISVFFSGFDRVDRAMTYSLTGSINLSQEIYILTTSQGANHPNMYVITSFEFLV
jgi:hypothetical protein